MTLPETDQGLFDGVLHADRRAIAKAITLLESTRSDHRAREKRPAAKMAQAQPEERQVEQQRDHANRQCDGQNTVEQQRQPADSTRGQISRIEEEHH